MSRELYLDEDLSPTVVDLLRLRGLAAVNSQESRAGMILVPSSFRGNEFSALAEAIAACVAAHPTGLEDRVVFASRMRS